LFSYDRSLGPFGALTETREQDRTDADDDDGYQDLDARRDEAAGPGRQISAQGPRARAVTELGIGNLDTPAAVYRHHFPTPRTHTNGWLRQTQSLAAPACGLTLNDNQRKEAAMHAKTEKAQIRVTRSSGAYWRVTFDNPPLNVMGPQLVREFREIITAVEADKEVKVLVFESAVEGFFLNHSDFNADLTDLTSLPQGPTGLEAWPDILVRITRMPVVSIALIRGRATGNGSEIALACDMSFASREKAVLSQWEVGVGLVAGGGPMARLPRLMGRQRALEVLLSSNDIGGDLAEAYGYVNRSLPDSELDSFVDALARRIASFDQWAIANTKRLVNAASLPPDVEIAAGWDTCMASIVRPAAQGKIKALFEQGFHRPGDAEDRLGFYLGRLGHGA
jgi:enoyl-CoA hydratase/carnithine racemase